MKNKSSAVSNRDQIIACAAELFLNQGIKATTMDTIVKESGVSKSNIYYHFKSKEEIVLAVVDWYITRFKQNVLGPFFARHQYATSKQWMESYFQVMADMVLLSECKTGNPFVSLIIQTAHGDDNIRFKISELYKSVEDRMVRVIREGMERGEFKNSIQPDQTASLLVGITEGAIILAHMHRDASVILNQGKTFLQLLKNV